MEKRMDTTIMENQMEKNMNNEMEPRDYRDSGFPKVWELKDPQHLKSDKQINTMFCRRCTCAQRCTVV